MSLDKTTYCTTSPADLPQDVTGAEIIFDTEGTGIDKMEDLPTLALFRIGANDYATPWTPATAQWVEDQFPKAALVTAHYAKHDYHMCLNGGVSADALYATRWNCTIIESVLCDESQYSYALDDLGVILFGETKSHQLYEVLAEKFGGKPTARAQGPNIGLVDVFTPSHELTALIKYGFQDLHLTDRLHQHWQDQIVKEELDKVLKLERRVISALVEVERRGAPIFVDQVDRVRVELEARATQLQERIIQLTGREINPRSPKDMVYAFTVLGIPIDKTVTGRPSFNKEVLEKLKEYEFIQALQGARSIKTLLDTFINSSIGGHMRGSTNRIHTTFNQVKTEDNGARTGRLSSSNPNLQQVPARDGELAPMVRGLFGHDELEWICADWEQFEFRVFGHYTKDPHLIKTYQDDPSTDFHQAVADLTGKERTPAKRINLGMVFGMGEGKLAKELGLPYTEVHNPRTGKTYLEAGPEAKEVFADYHARFPGAKQVLNQAANLARYRGYVKSLYGRRLRFPNGGEHKAGGLVFQSTSADIMKAKLVELNDEFRKGDTQFILTVHDEFDFLTPAEQVPVVKPKIKKILETVPELRIPILSDINSGRNWWAASKGA